MRVSSFLGIFIPLASALLESRAINDPGSAYLGRMCLPELSNRSSPNSINTQLSRLAFSEFPCEQALFIQSVCIANGTEPIDFLAEQQCLCNGAFFHVTEGCAACYLAHGQIIPGEKPLEVVKASISSLKVLECSTGPATQAFSNLFPPTNVTSVRLSPTITLAPDPFFNDTAVSNYFTPTTVIAPGVITGSATARATSWTNYSGVRYTPTPASGNSTQTSVKSSSSLSSTTETLTASPSTTAPPSSNAVSAPGVSAATTTSGNGAGSLHVQSAAGGLLAAMVGVVVLL